MKTISGLIIGMLILSIALWGQHGGEGGNTCDIWGYRVIDNSCSSGGCETGTFTAPNCPNFWLYCGGYDAYHQANNCPKVTVTLTPVGQSNPIATCQNWDQEGCGGVTNGTQVSLTPGAVYVLTVCFDPCYGHSCQDCQGTHAEGLVTVVHP